MASAASTLHFFDAASHFRVDGLNVAITSADSLWTMSTAWDGRKPRMITTHISMETNLLTPVAPSE
jgi:hypothetical protein